MGVLGVASPGGRCLGLAAEPGWVGAGLVGLVGGVATLPPLEPSGKCRRDAAVLLFLLRRIQPELYRGALRAR